MDSVSLYSEARNEYLKQLSTWITPPLVEFFRKEYDTISAREGRRAMGVFQGFCAEVPRWNQDVIDTNIGHVLSNCRCDYVEELMTAVFIAHTKMLTAIRVSTKQKKLSINLPKLDHFLHRVFVECARSFWKAPFLFADELSPVERQKNILQAESMCHDSISGAVRSLLPVKSILRDYLDEESDEEAAPAAAPASAPASVSASLKSNAANTSASVAQTTDPELKALEEIDQVLEEEEEMPIVPEPVAPEAPTATAPVAPVAPTPTATAPVAPVAPAAVATIPEKIPVHIEKVNTDPETPIPTSSTHSVETSQTPKNVIIVQKSEETHAPSVSEGNHTPPQLMIDTEPSVHFTPYDTVYDETTQGISEIRYAPKISVEDKPPSTWGMDKIGGDDEDDDENIPRLSISGADQSIGLDDVFDFNGQPLVSAVTPEEDVDMPLGASDDFEELA
jgi:hypothetical protein